MTHYRTVSFVVALSDAVRRRHTHHRLGTKVVRFVIQLEVLAGGEGKWMAVVRYDTAHGFAHRDLIHPDESIDKTPLFLQSLNEALDYAEADIRANWEQYIEHFLKEIKP
jgi:hypothetical protein